MIGLEGKTLASDDLTFRLAVPEDKPALFSIMSDAESTVPAGALPLNTMAEMDVFWERLTAYNTCLSILHEGVCIGYFHVNIKFVPNDPAYRDRRNASIGFIIAKAYQRRGYASQTLRTLCEYLRPRFDHIWAECFEENIASQRTLCKCGFIPVDVYEREFSGLDGETKKTIGHILQ